MRKITSLLLLFAFVLLLLTGCGQSEKSGGETADSFDPSLLKTVGDVFARADNGEYQEGFSETEYVVIFTVNGVYYRAYADMSAEVADALWALDFDEFGGEKARELVSPLEIRTLENLSEQIPTQEDLEKLAGVTGQELFDDGWIYWYCDLESMQAGMYHDAFSYTVTFAYDGEPVENTDDFDFYEVFKDLRVASVVYDGIGDATESVS